MKVYVADQQLLMNVMYVPVEQQTIYLILILIVMMNVLVLPMLMDAEHVQAVILVSFHYLTIKDVVVLH